MLSIESHEEAPTEGWLQDCTIEGNAASSRVKRHLPRLVRDGRDGARNAETHEQDKPREAPHEQERLLVERTYRSFGDLVADPVVGHTPESGRSNTNAETPCSCTPIR